MLRHSNDDLEIAVPRILRARTPWKNYIAIELEKHKEACNVSRKKKKKKGTLFIPDALATPHRVGDQRVYSEKETEKSTDTWLGLFLI